MSNEYEQNFFDRLWRGKALWLAFSAINLLTLSIGLEKGHKDLMLSGGISLILTLIATFVPAQYKTPPWRIK